LDHVTAPLVERMVFMHLDQMVVALGLHQINFRSDMLVKLVDSLCEGHMDCTDFLTSITGTNCCFNASKIEYYLDYEPHPSSVKNIRHLFQMIRKGTFAQYDYGYFKNLRTYGLSKPPEFILSHIPASLPMWMGYGGTDGLADVTDVEHTLAELPSSPELLYLEDYGHIDFVLGSSAKEDVYKHMIQFFRAKVKSSSW
jgi:lysosomal acid lipase/cholesteryl ester hydrolase